MLWWDRGYAIYLFPEGWETWCEKKVCPPEMRFVGEGEYDPFGFNKPPCPIDFPEWKEIIREIRNKVPLSINKIAYFNGGKFYEIDFEEEMVRMIEHSEPGEPYLPPVWFIDEAHPIDEETLEKIWNKFAR